MEFGKLLPRNRRRVSSRLSCVDRRPPFARRGPVPHRRRQLRFKAAIEFAKPRITVAAGVGCDISVPEDQQCDMLAIQLPMDYGPIWLDEAAVSSFAYAICAKRHLQFGVPEKVRYLDLRRSASRCTLRRATSAMWSARWRLGNTLTETVMSPAARKLGSVEQTGLERRRVLQLTFPEHQHSPPAPLEVCALTRVALDRRRKLSLPKVAARRGQACTGAAFMPVPEASVHEYGEPTARQNQVRATRKFLVVQAKPEPQSMRNAAH